ncbi:hypothetical protein [Nocardia sp. NPDC052566]|uniref:hypothetical protein n=1 Tax=Nocardia sp. NPDC052566 TaxID=3364330 RepID=UPI0037C8950D
MVIDCVRSIFEGVVADGLRRGSVRGASDPEIGRFAAAQGLTSVSVAVREVLRLIGAQQGLWSTGSDFGVIGVASDAKSCTVEALSALDNDFKDLAGLLVLSSHQGYAYYVIDGADLGLDDPPVWDVVAGESAGNGWQSVSSWFAATAPDVEDLRDVMESMAEMVINRRGPTISSR